MNPSPLTQAALELSIVIPVFNEGRNIRPLLDSLKQHLNPLTLTYEIIFINDGSQDETWEEILEYAKQDPRIKGLALSRNFGHQHAILAGYTVTQGRAIISMDGDLQHPPKLIPDMIREWKNGYKIVNTQRMNHPTTSFFKKLTSKYYYRFFSFLSDVPIQEGSSDFRLIDRQVLDHLLQFNDLEYFFRGIVNWIGFPKTSLSYQEEKRSSDKSKYSAIRMIKFAISGIVAFSSAPLKIGIWIGLLTSLLAFAEIVYILIKYMQGVTVPGWASIVGIISFLFGILFILLGCIGLYIANIHENLKNRPRFIIYEKINIA